ncbi:hypothetical protein ACA910_019113 [Epithemia clementina (nom. ined.)]
MESTNLSKYVVQIQAYAVVLKFAPAIKLQAEADLPAKENDPIDTSAAGKTAGQAKRQNEIVFVHLSIVLQSKQMVGLLMKAMATEWPSSLAWKVVELLHIRFIPVDTMSKIEIQKLLNQVGMKRREDPGTLFK